MIHVLDCHRLSQIALISLCRGTYILFTVENAHKVPTMEGLNLPNTKLLGEMWKNLPEQEKQASFFFFIESPGMVVSQFW